MRRMAAFVLGLVLLAGCASGTPTGSASAVPPGGPASGTLDIAITLKDGTADPNGERVETARGTTLVLTITSDHDDEVHVHGYDVEIPVTAGKPVTERIVLDRGGRFEVESHEPALTILQLIVS